MVIDGRKAHAVVPYEGERFSLVYYNVRQSWTLDEAARGALRSLGFRWPDERAATAMARHWEGRPAKEWDVGLPRETESLAGQFLRAWEAAESGRAGGIENGPLGRADGAYAAFAMGAAARSCKPQQNERRA